MSEIKSVKAKELLEASIVDTKTIKGCVLHKSAYTAVIIAETEAEERHEKQLQELRDKAVEAFKSVRIITPHTLKCECTYDENAVAELRLFIQKLNEK